MNEVELCPSCGTSDTPFHDGDKLIYRICAKCIQRRDKKHEHSEEDIQDSMKKNLDNPKRSPYIY